MVTLKIGPRLPKSDKDFCIDANFTIHKVLSIQPLTEEKGCRQVVFRSKYDILSAYVTLKMGSRSHKKNLPTTFLMMCHSKFSQNLHIGFRQCSFLKTNSYGDLQNRAKVTKI